mgnify:CR=1 FL=1
MWQQNYEPLGGSLGLSALVAAIPILVLFFMLGVQAQAGVDGGARRRSARASFWRSLAYGDAGAARASCRRCTGAAFGLFPIAWIVFALDHALPAGGRHRQVRDHQGLGRRSDQRSAAAGAVHRVLVRRVHRRRGRLRRAGRGRRARCWPGSGSRRSTPPASACSRTRRRWRSGRSAFR